MDRPEYLSFMIEGDYTSYMDENDTPLEEAVGTETMMLSTTKSYMAPRSFRKRGDTLEQQKIVAFAKARAALSMLTSCRSPAPTA